MSGTSLDGVDGVLADFDAQPPRILGHASAPLPNALRAELLALNTSGPNEMHRAALAANALMRVYAQVVSALLDRSGLNAAQVRAIGAHGQTVRHRPQAFDGTGYTIQLCQPALLAELSAPTPVEGGHALAHQRLFDGQYVCVMRHDHPLATQALDLDTFCQARHLLVSFSGRPFGFVDEALASLGRERHVVLTVNQFFTAGQVVAHSNLLTVLPQHFLSVTGVFDQLVIKPLPFQVPTVHVDMVWRKRARLPNAHQWLRQAVARASLQTLARIKA